MVRKLISTGSPMERQAGYSRAVIDGDMVFVAGTTGYDYERMVMPADVRQQTRNCLATIADALSEGGFALSDVVQARYYVTDKENVPSIFEELGHAFGDIRPAATMIICELIKDEMLIEIEVVAKK